MTLFKVKANWKAHTWSRGSSQDGGLASFFWVAIHRLHL